MGLPLKYNLKTKLMPLCCRQNSLPGRTRCRLHVSLINLTWEPTSIFLLASKYFALGLLGLHVTRPQNKAHFSSSPLILRQKSWTRQNSTEFLPWTTHGLGGCFCYWLSTQTSSIKLRIADKQVPLARNIKCYLLAWKGSQILITVLTHHNHSSVCCHYHFTNKNHTILQNWLA